MPLDFKLSTAAEAEAYSETISSGTLASELRAFIAEYVRTLEHLEVLLLLQGAKEKKWSATDVSQELPFDPITASNRLMELYLLGLVTHGPASGKLSGYQYSPPKRLARTIDALAGAYRAAPELIRGLVVGR